METLLYLAKINVFLAVFYSCFWLLFRKHTFFHWNRFYLLGSLIISLILPSIKVSETYTESIPAAIYNIPASQTLAAVSQVEKPALDWTTFLLPIYCAGVIVFLSRLLLSFYKLFITIQKSARLNVEGHTLVLLDETQRVDTSSFSFFKWLVVSAEDYKHNPDVILRHEYVHIRQWHSLDIVFVEFLKVVFWINPVVWFYKRSMQAVHEFLADQQISDRDQYANFLVSYALNVPQTTVTNHFFDSSLLKSRIRMIYKNPTSRWLLGKYILILPITLLAVFLTAAREQVPEQSIQNKVELVRDKIVFMKSDSVNISGSVIDGKGNKISDAIIVLAGSKRGTSTDMDGKFELNAMPVDGRLVISHVKFKSLELLLEKNKTIYSITLHEDAAVNSVAEKSGDKFVNYNVGKSNQSTKSGFKVIEQKPQFPGGHAAMIDWLKDNMRYPERALMVNVGGIALVQFTVDEEGKIGDVVLIKGIGFGIDWEAVNLVKKMPKWEPAIQNGKPVAMTQAIEIKFDLEEGRLKTRQGLFLKVKQPESLFTMDDLGRQLKKIFDFSVLENVPTPVKSDTVRTSHVTYRYIPYQIATPRYKYHKPTQY
ncbi:M56 family metallopeptidase [Dyadobacter arcticus]|uniref:TonB family protein n=1 Tax=Dyadobacter arcticus TaxID=1078754 RepID=A0ABX0UUC8_9BACT|nr:M56 family metallopeptidase [Dyadobacter arcticus]NIJ55355.1 TonB family protein [Dyadobacter arcticus]